MNTLLFLFVAYVLPVAAAIFFIKKKSDSKVQDFKTLEEGLRLNSLKKQEAEKSLSELERKIINSKDSLEKINRQTLDLQELRSNATSISAQLELDHNNLELTKQLLSEKNSVLDQLEEHINMLMSKIDLYNRLEEFVSYGHFETPEYLYETGERFASEIRRVREEQKSLIKNRKAALVDGQIQLTGDITRDKKIIDGQIMLVLRTFNIECDLLISKVKPSNYERTLDRIEKLANSLEGLVASLRCGLSIDYVTLKYEECTLQYQYTLKSKEEAEEQQLIREQMREEAKAEREYRKAVEAAEKEEKLYRELLSKARAELLLSSEQDRAATQVKIEALETRLAEAELKEQRALSMAQQTRRGHVYVISNIGSFGENIYKIGMTRRLDPMDRVKELGDASVPFSFDVHAVIYSDDAPALETELHRQFSHHRVNAVNLRKEFFHVELDAIEVIVNQLEGLEVEFKKTIAAEDYYETKRLREHAMS